MCVCSMCVCSMCVCSMCVCSMCVDSMCVCSMCVCSMCVDSMCVDKFFCSVSNYTINASVQGTVGSLGLSDFNPISQKFPHKCL